MRAILIDPEAETITDIEYSGSLDELYELLECTRFTNCPVERSSAGQEGMYCDDEALLKPAHLMAHSFMIYGQPIHGRALICAANTQGADIASELELDVIKERVTFVGLGAVAMILTKQLAGLRIQLAQAKSITSRAGIAALITQTTTQLDAVRARL